MWGVDSPVTNIIDPDRKKGLSELNDEKMCISIFKKPFIITVGALHFCADVCPSCDHIVASHEYTFRVEGQYQVFPELNNQKSSHLSQLSKHEEQITIPQSSKSFHSSHSSLSYQSS